MTRRRMFVTAATSAAMALAGVGAWILADHLAGGPATQLPHGAIVYGPYRIPFVPGQTRPLPLAPRFAPLPPRPQAPQQPAG